MRIDTKHIGVDAGMIMVADMDYLLDVPSPDEKRIKKLGQTFEVPIGRYHVAWHIPHTWNGDIGGTATLEVTSGKIFVCDPCYCIGRDKHEDWMKYLNETDFCRNLNTEIAFILDEMGGDGEYNVHLNLTKI